VPPSVKFVIVREGGLVTPLIVVSNDKDRRTQLFLALKDNCKALSFKILNTHLEIIFEIMMPENSFNPNMLL